MTGCGFVRHRLVSQSEAGGGEGRRLVGIKENKEKPRPSGANKFSLTRGAPDRKSRRQGDREGGRGGKKVKALSWAGCDESAGDQCSSQ